MQPRNRFALVPTERGPRTALALRVIVAVAMGLIAWTIGYCLARFAGHHAFCAAGRSPSSLGLVLGIATLIAAWSHTHGGVTKTGDERSFGNETK